MVGRSEPARRRSAAESRERVLEAATREFAAFGLYGATGEGIAYRAGISHPYLLRLSGSKKELFLAVVGRTFDVLGSALSRQLEEGGARVSTTDVAAHLQAALDVEDASPLLLQFLAACGDEEVRLVVRSRVADLHRQLSRVADGDDDRFRLLLEQLIFRSATAALHLPELSGRERWARRLLGST